MCNPNQNGKKPQVPVVEPALTWQLPMQQSALIVQDPPMELQVTVAVTVAESVSTTEVSKTVEEAASRVIVEVAAGSMPKQEQALPKAPVPKFCRGFASGVTAGNCGERLTGPDPGRLVTVVKTVSVTVARMVLVVISPAGVMVSVAVELATSSLQ
jgi:hypothetical protein